MFALVLRHFKGSTLLMRKLQQSQHIIIKRRKCKILRRKMRRMKFEAVMLPIVSWKLDIWAFSSLLLLVLLSSTEYKLHSQRSTHSPLAALKTNFCFYICTRWANMCEPFRSNFWNHSPMKTKMKGERASRGSARTSLPTKSRLAVVVPR